MKASELRLGNFVHHNENNKAYIDNYLTVCELAEKSITTFYRSFDGSIQVVRNKKDYQPIPLTEEWLLRFGFEKDGPGWYWLSTKDRFTDLGYSYNLTTNVFEFDNCDLPDVHFVHQLQNLFWALCGKELEIIT